MCSNCEELSFGVWRCGRGSCDSPLILKHPQTHAAHPSCRAIVCLNASLSACWVSSPVYWNVLTTIKSQTQFIWAYVRAREGWDYTAVAKEAEWDLIVSVHNENAPINTFLSRATSTLGLYTASYQKKWKQNARTTRVVWYTWSCTKKSTMIPKIYHVTIASFCRFHYFTWTIMCSVQEAWHELKGNVIH